MLKTTFWAIRFSVSENEMPSPVTPADSSEDVDEEEEQEKIRHGAVAKVVKDAKFGNDLDGKHVENKAARYVSI